MAKRWDDSRFPWAFRSKGCIRALRRTFQFALKSPGPGLMPLINIRDKPPRVSPFPTGNTCKPRLYQPLRIPEGIADGGTPNLELDFTWNELLPVVGAEFREEGIGAEAINRRKISVPSRGGGGKTTRAIDSKSDYGGGGKRCSSVVVELQIRYRDKEEGETIYICTQLQFEKRWRILMTGRLPLIRNTSIILLLSLI